MLKPLGKKGGQNRPPSGGEPPTAANESFAAIEFYNHELSDDYDPRLLLLRAPDSPRAAAFRVLRHKVIHQGNPKTILVTSPGIGEGKTMVATNLAIALAETGARVLLLETNLRSPQLAHVFGFTPPWCFSAQLIAHAQQPQQPWRLVEVTPTGLHVGAVDPMVEHERFDATGFAIAISQFVASKYDHILIDAPPVLGAAEVNLMQDNCDCILFTGLAGRVNARGLRQSVEQLAPANILGFALVEGSPRG
jgi:tyrosine-protein kinase Etk/Wzc